MLANYNREIYNKIGVFVFVNEACGKCMLENISVCGNTPERFFERRRCLVS